MKRTAFVLVLLALALGSAAAAPAEVPSPSASVSPTSPRGADTPPVASPSPAAAAGTPSGGEVTARPAAQDREGLGRLALEAAQALVDRMMACYRGALAWLREHRLWLG